MANEEHLEILRQGVEVWNRWREENPETIPDLSGTFLHAADLSQADLGGANLRLADLRVTDLRRVDLGRADLYRAILSGANLFVADLRGADLRQAYLTSADLYGANLHEANLRQADLSGANLRQAELSGADLTGAAVGHTVFADVDLIAVKGLETIKHQGPSYIDIHTIYRSGGKIPEAFLRGCGVPDTFIAYIASLTGEAIQYYSCFISYSTQDQAFAQRLHNDLQGKGVRCWFAPEDMKIGDEIRPRIQESIKGHDKLLLVLSEHSINSAWVKTEVETALEEEIRRNKTVLFPVRLDGTVMETDQAWAADIRRTRHIGDFSRWKDHDSYQEAFTRLLRDLKASEA
jgi:uncharacterized protein YjbI with pentapeptide repeats